MNILDLIALPKQNNSKRSNTGQNNVITCKPRSDDALLLAYRAEAEHANKKPVEHLTLAERKAARAIAGNRQVESVKKNCKVRISGAQTC